MGSTASRERPNCCRRLSIPTIQPFSNWLWPSYLHLPFRPRLRKGSDSVFFKKHLREAQSGRPALIRFVLGALERDPSLSHTRFSGKTLLHAAAAAGCLEALTVLLRLGVDPNIQDAGRHTPLYSVANECASSSGAEVVRALVRAGADVNACDGVVRTTPLHMAARRGHVEIARALLDCGAVIDVRDAKGDTPLQRAINCRRGPVAELLRQNSPQ